MKLIVLIALILALALADSCGGNCPSGGFFHLTSKLDDFKDIFRIS